MARCKVNLSAPDGASVSYEGWEAHSELVDTLNEHFASQNRCFRLADAVAAPFPEVDLVIARDILFHMRPDLALRIVDKAWMSAAYFMATSFIGAQENIGPEAYMPIENW